MNTFPESFEEPRPPNYWLSVASFVEIPTDTCSDSISALQNDDFGPESSGQHDHSVTKEIINGLSAMVVSENTDSNINITKTTTHNTGSQETDPDSSAVEIEANNVNTIFCQSEPTNQTNPWKLNHNTCNGGSGGSGPREQNAYNALLPDSETRDLISSGSDHSITSNTRNREPNGNNSTEKNSCSSDTLNCTSDNYNSIHFSGTGTTSINPCQPPGQEPEISAGTPKRVWIRPKLRVRMKSCYCQTDLEEGCQEAGSKSSTNGNEIKGKAQMHRVPTLIEKSEFPKSNPSSSINSKMPNAILLNSTAPPKPPAQDETNFLLNSSNYPSTQIGFKKSTEYPCASASPSKNLFYTPSPKCKKTITAFKDARRNKAHQQSSWEASTVQPKLHNQPKFLNQFSEKPPGSCWTSHGLISDDEISNHVSKAYSQSYVEGMGKQNRAYYGSPSSLEVEVIPDANDHIRMKFRKKRPSDIKIPGQRKTRGPRKFTSNNLSELPEDSPPVLSSPNDSNDVPMNALYESGTLRTELSPPILKAQTPSTSVSNSAHGNSGHHRKSGETRTGEHVRKKGSGKIGVKDEKLLLTPTVDMLRLDDKMISELMNSISQRAYDSEDLGVPSSSSLIFNVLAQKPGGSYRRSLYIPDNRDCSTEKFAMSSSDNATDLDSDDNKGKGPKGNNVNIINYGRKRRQQIDKDFKIKLKIPFPKRADAYYFRHNSKPSEASEPLPVHKKTRSYIRKQTRIKGKGKAKRKTKRKYKPQPQVPESRLDLCGIQVNPSIRFTKGNYTFLDRMLNRANEGSERLRRGPNFVPDSSSVQGSIQNDPIMNENEKDGQLMILNSPVGDVEDGNGINLADFSQEKVMDAVEGTGAITRITQNLASEECDPVTSSAVMITAENITTTETSTEDKPVWVSQNVLENTIDEVVENDSEKLCSEDILATALQAAVFAEPPISSIQISESTSPRPLESPVLPLIDVSKNPNIIDIPISTTIEQASPVTATLNLMVADSIYENVLHDDQNPDNSSEDTSSQNHLTQPIQDQTPGHEHKTPVKITRFRAGESESTNPFDCLDMVVSPLVSQEIINDRMWMPGRGFKMGEIIQIDDDDDELVQDDVKSLEEDGESCDSISAVEKLANEVAAEIQKANFDREASIAEANKLLDCDDENSSSNCDHEDGSRDSSCSSTEPNDLDDDKSSDDTSDQGDGPSSPDTDIDDKCENLGSVELIEIDIDENSCDSVVIVYDDNYVKSKTNMPGSAAFVNNDKSIPILTHEIELGKRSESMNQLMVTEIVVPGEICSKINVVTVDEAEVIPLSLPNAPNKTGSEIINDKNAEENPEDISETRNASLFKETVFKLTTEEPSNNSADPSEDMMDSEGQNTTNKGKETSQTSNLVGGSLSLQEKDDENLPAETPHDISLSQIINLGSDGTGDEDTTNKLTFYADTEEDPKTSEKVVLSTDSGNSTINNINLNKSHSLAFKASASHTSDIDTVVSKLKLQQNQNENQLIEEPKEAETSKSICKEREASKNYQSSLPKLSRRKPMTTSKIIMQSDTAGIRIFPSLDINKDMDTGPSTSVHNNLNSADIHIQNMLKTVCTGNDGDLRYVRRPSEPSAILNLSLSEINSSLGNISDSDTIHLRDILTQGSSMTKAQEVNLPSTISTCPDTPDSIPKGDHNSNPETQSQEPNVKQPKAKRVYKPRVPKAKLHPLVPKAPRQLRGKPGPKKRVNLPENNIYFSQTLTSGVPTEPQIIHDSRRVSRATHSYTLTLSETLEKLCLCTVCQKKFQYPYEASECLREHKLKQCWICFQLVFPTDTFKTHNKRYHPSLCSTHLGSMLSTDSGWSTGVECRFCQEFLPFTISLRNHMEIRHFQIYPPFTSLERHRVSISIDSTSKEQHSVTRAMGALNLVRVPSVDATNDALVIKRPRLSSSVNSNASQGMETASDTHSASPEPGPLSSVIITSTSVSNSQSTSTAVLITSLQDSSANPNPIPKTMSVQQYSSTSFGIAVQSQLNQPLTNIHNSQSQINLTQGMQMNSSNPYPNPQRYSPISPPLEDQAIINNTSSACWQTLPISILPMNQPRLNNGPPGNNPAANRGWMDLPGHLRPRIPVSQPQQLQNPQAMIFGSGIPYAENSVPQRGQPTQHRGPIRLPNYQSTFGQQQLLRRQIMKDQNVFGYQPPQRQIMTSWGECIYRHPGMMDNQRNTIFKPNPQHNCFNDNHGVAQPQMVDINYQQKQMRPYFRGTRHQQNSIRYKPPHDVSGNINNGIRNTEPSSILITDQTRKSVPANVNHQRVTLPQEPWVSHNQPIHRLNSKPFYNPACTTCPSCRFHSNDHQNVQSIIRQGINERQRKGNPDSSNRYSNISNQPPVVIQTRGWKKVPVRQSLKNGSGEQHVTEPSFYESNQGQFSSTHSSIPLANSRIEEINPNLVGNNSSRLPINEQQLPILSSGLLPSNLPNQPQPLQNIENTGGSDGQPQSIPASQPSRPDPVEQPASPVKVRPGHEISNDKLPLVLIPSNLSNQSYQNILNARGTNNQNEDNQDQTSARHSISPKSSRMGETDLNSVGINNQSANAKNDEQLSLVLIPSKLPNQSQPNIRNMGCSNDQNKVPVIQNSRIYPIGKPVNVINEPPLSEESQIQTWTTQTSSPTSSTFADMNPTSVGIISQSPHAKNGEQLPSVLIPSKVPHQSHPNIRNIYIGGSDHSDDQNRVPAIQNSKIDPIEKPVNEINEPVVSENSQIQTSTTQPSSPSSSTIANTTPNTVGIISQTPQATNDEQLQLISVPSDLSNQSHPNVRTVEGSDDQNKVPVIQNSKTDPITEPVNEINEPSVSESSEIQISITQPSSSSCSTIANTTPNSVGIISQTPQATNDGQLQLISVPSDLSNQPHPNVRTVEGSDDQNKVPVIQNSSIDPIAKPVNEINEPSVSESSQIQTSITQPSSPSSSTIANTTPNPIGIISQTPQATNDEQLKLISGPSDLSNQSHPNGRTVEGSDDQNKVPVIQNSSIDPIAGPVNEINEPSVSVNELSVSESSQIQTSTTLPSSPSRSTIANTTPNPIGIISQTPQATNDEQLQLVLVPSDLSNQTHPNIQNTNDSNDQIEISRSSNQNPPFSPITLEFATLLKQFKNRDETAVEIYKLIFTDWSATLSSDDMELLNKMTHEEVRNLFEGTILDYSGIPWPDGTLILPPGRPQTIISTQPLEEFIQTQNRSLNQILVSFKKVKQVLSLVNSAGTGTE